MVNMLQLNRLLPIVLLSFLVSSCIDPYGVYYLFVHVPGYGDGTGDMPRGYQLGDTVIFVATEQYAEGSRGSPAGPSSDEPLEYHWESTDESVALVVAPGRVWMRRTGRAWLRVSAGHANSRLLVEILVVPRVAGVRISPLDTAIAVGDTVSVIVSGIDSLGRVIPEISRPNGLAAFLQPDLPANYSNPIGVNVVTDDTSRYLIRGFRRGVVALYGFLPIQGAQNYRAPARIEVR